MMNITPLQIFHASGNHIFNNCGVSHPISCHSVYGGIYLYQMCLRNRQKRSSITQSSSESSPTLQENTSISNQILTKAKSGNNTNYTTETNVPFISLPTPPLAALSSTPSHRKSPSSLASSSLSASTHESSVSSSSGSSLVLQRNRSAHTIQSLNITSPRSSSYWEEEGTFSPWKVLALRVSNLSSRSHLPMFDDTAPPNYIQWLCRKFEGDI
ncbi:putative uncharacterized protein DDB_G0277255 [Hermetia illucens]|uniref:putative uncharacterized protein DDB_G0277255 n=1 Tax=Hermetia illucens TaxID=343691 RepID=UPI0018CC68F6|nr:putative uncharacterized protein DDB_G0277255 [Hermetia illucens]XP_037924742.1 putative uncharacterized protein DDB_G0277255 [Hermetia illucens]